MNDGAQISNKAQEVGYALMRLAPYVRRKELRSRFEGLAVALVETVASEEPDTASSTIAAIRNIVNLAVSIYEVEPINANALLERLEYLNAAIRQLSGRGPLPSVGELFRPVDGGENGVAASFRANAVKDATSSGVRSQEQSGEYVIPAPEGISETRVDIEHDIAADLFPGVASSEEEPVKSTSAMVSVGSAIRQSAILAKIKESSNRQSQGSAFRGCRMKDLIAEFPDVSERTLRYDLQRLLQQGSIDRIGNGGPASYYVMK